MFETKFAIVLRDDLAQWQKLNVTAFLATGIAGQKPEIVGEPYRDAGGNVYNALSIQPIIVLSADGPTLSNIRRRARTQYSNLPLCRRDVLDRPR